MPTLQLSEIWIYPIKSLAGLSLQQASLTSRGLLYDRRWMLVDETGRFLSQRTLPQLVLFDVRMEENSLIITHRESPSDPLRIPLVAEGGEALQVEVWDDTMSAQGGFPEANAWFSERLGRNCRLVYQPESTHRTVDPRYARQGEITSFSDGYPFLLIGQASLDDLNTRLETPVPMNRFRPNLVVTGGQPYEEEGWENFRIGEQEFWGVKPCARCVLTTIDQQTAEKGKEPLRTLSKYRNWNNKILFGQNLLPGADLHTLRVGDSVDIIKSKPGPLEQR